MLKKLKSSPSNAYAYLESSEDLNNDHDDTEKVTKTKKSNSFLSFFSFKKEDANPKFNLEITESNPTYEQAKSIYQLLLEQQQKEKLKTIYPWIEDRESSTTPFISKQQYDGLKIKLEHPVVVDWDHGVIAIDESGTEEMLKKYSS